MNGVKISDKQREFLTTPFARINLLEGSVRSGKTWISIVAWALFVASMPRDAEFLMVGKTMGTLRRNVLGLMQELEPSFIFNTGTKKATLYGRTIWLEGAVNERSENQIRGMTLAGAYIDEITLCPENFYYMVLSRLSYNGAKLFATTNPDSPNHYVYTDIIQNETINKRVTKFLIYENPFLDPEYVEQLGNEYSGVFYQRYYLGEWVIAKGLVYPMYDNTVPTVNRNYKRYVASMDYGIQNPTAIILWGLCDGIWYGIRELYHSGRDENNQKTDQQYYDDMERMFGNIHPDYLYIDPSAASFIALVRQIGKYKVRQCNNDVTAGIQNTALALSERLILFNDCCRMTLREFGLYSWDDKRASDAVIKENDHAMDAVRYFVQSERVAKRQAEKEYISPFG